jgi:DNA helicase HerA-like ATPase
VGTVESVSPNEIRVVLDLDAPQAIALNAGEPQRFPRINGFVLVPNETGSLVGVVAWLGVERSPYPKRTGLRDFGLVDLPYPLRKMAVVPLGTLKSRLVDGTLHYELHRGVAGFPSVGDPVHLPTSSELRALVEARDADRRVTIGTSPLGANAAVSVDPDKLFGRHLAILGNTGSGKSCSVAGLIRWSLQAAEGGRLDPSAPTNARFIVLDPNGEYRQTFADLANVRLFEVNTNPGSDVEGPDADPLRVPAWMWDSHEWAAFAQAAAGTQRPLLVQGLRNMRAGATLEGGPGARLARLASIRR